MKGRIAPPGDKELQDLLESLTTASRRDDFPLFETKQKALMFAAGLGRRLNRRKPLKTRDARSAIRFDIFEKNSDDDFVYALAVHDSGDLQVLHPDREEDVATTFEEFANAGLQEILRLSSRTGADTFDVMMHLVQEARSSLEVPPDGLDADVFKGLLG